MSKGGDWIPFYRSLRSGAKRALSRATRFIYLELSMESRAYSGRLPLPAGFKSDVDAVHDILGGKRSEIAEALEALTTPSGSSAEPMITLSGPQNSRVLTVVTHDLYVRTDKSTERVRRFREKQKSSSESYQATTDDCNAFPCSTETPQNRVEKSREEKRREPPVAPQGGPPAGQGSPDDPMSGIHRVAAPMASPPVSSKPARRSRNGDGRKPFPNDFAVSPEIEAMCLAEGLPDPHAVIRDFRDKSLAKDYRYVDWEAAFRAWMRSAITRRDYPVWAPKTRVRPRREDLLPTDPESATREIPSFPDDMPGDLFTTIGRVLP